ncbi:MAG: DMT family transporter [Hyphomicrobiales bacterium]|nr:DMT family transporter [Hyphomicrobiales bacterium]
MIQGGVARALAAMALSTLIFAVMHMLVRHVSAEVHPIQIAFFRNLFGLIVFLPWLMRQGLAPLRTKRFPLHALRGAVNAVAMFAFFTGLSLTPLAKATALGFTAPIFAGLLSIALLGERFRLRRWSAIACGFAGVLVILRPGLIAIDLGAALVLFSSLLWGATIIVIKVLGRTESSVTTTIYMNLLLALFSFVPALFVWRTPGLEAWLWLVAIGVLGTLAQILLAQALKDSEPGVVMPLDFLRLIWASALGFLVFAEVPELFVWIGGAVIFASSTYLAYREAKAGVRRPKTGHL